MDSWSAEEVLRRRNQLGFPDFPPTESVFADGEYQYFITVVGPDADLDEVRRFSSTGETRRGGSIFLVAELIELASALFNLLFRNSHSSVVAISRAPIGVDVREWSVIYRETVVTLNDEDMAVKHLGSLIKDWPGLKQRQGW